VRFRTNGINHSLSLRDKYHSIILHRCDQLVSRRAIARNDGIKRALRELILSIFPSLRFLIGASGLTASVTRIGALNRRPKKFLAGASLLDGIAH
jgi:hypothetical protein